MLARLFTLLALTASALASNVTFRHPIAKPAFQVELLGKLPYNVTLPGGETLLLFRTEEALSLVSLMERSLGI